jgi:hypothetical protein
MNEETIDYLEAKIPELAELALKKAYWETLASGSSVLEVTNNILYETFPNGAQKIIKHLEPATLVKCGQILEAR